MISTEPAPVSSHEPGPLADQLRLAATAYLARFKGSFREHTGSTYSGARAHGSGAGSVSGPGFPDLGDKVLDGRESEVRAVAEDRVARSGKTDEASGFRWQLAG